ncbi:MAG: phosphatase PAP2 family protein [Acidobacteria bacterium]|nr:phosphatase PAP2 family protein [Acidobacteriota bacterium]
MMAAWGIARRLCAVDVLTMVVATVAGASAGVLAAGPPEALPVSLVCAAIVCGVPLLAWVRTYLDLAVIRVVHDWSLALVVYPVYRSVLVVTRLSHGDRLWDGWLMAADRRLFGMDPTIWLQPIASPAVTEVLQVAYACFYVFFLAVAAELYASGREARFRQWAFVCGFGFYLLYVGYLSMPAIGPRFTLTDSAAIARELPGIWLTPWLRSIIDGGAGVPTGVPDTIAIEFAARDAFPSGHTMMTLVAIAWSWRYRLRVRWPITIIGALLIVATVYLRYHYVVDVLAGAILAGVCLAIAPRAHAWLAWRLGTLDADPMR